MSPWPGRGPRKGLNRSQSPKEPLRAELHCPTWWSVIMATLCPFLSCSVLSSLSTTAHLLASHLTSLGPCWGCQSTSSRKQIWPSHLSEGSSDFSRDKEQSPTLLPRLLLMTERLKPQALRTAHSRQIPGALLSVLQAFRLPWDLPLSFLSSAVSL